MPGPLNKYQRKMETVFFSFSFSVRKPLAFGRWLGRFAITLDWNIIVPSSPVTRNCATRASSLGESKGKNSARSVSQVSRVLFKSLKKIKVRIKIIFGRMGMINVGQG